MAAVVHALWEGNDQFPLILPGTVPLDDRTVQAEMTRILPDAWQPIIDAEIDGPNSLAVRIEREVPTLGQAAACRRVARTIFVGTAPLSEPAHRGLDVDRIKLGSAFPDESLAVFGDAVRHLAGKSTYLYQDGQRYWFALQPTLRALAEGRAEQLRRSPEKVFGEIERRLREERLREEAKGEKDDVRIHPCARNGSDVPDDFIAARLVVLPPDVRYAKGESSDALERAKVIWEQRGSSPRMYRNTLVFLAADAVRAEALEEAVRMYLAWSSIVEDAPTLELTPTQQRQAKETRDREDRTVRDRLVEAYCWLLVPHQDNPRAAFEDVEWRAERVQESDGLYRRALRKLLSEGTLVQKLGGPTLRHHLDAVPLWRGNHVEVSQLIDDFGRYVYLPRLTSPRVLTEAIADGVDQSNWEVDGFAFAERFDAETERYVGLRAGSRVSIHPDAPSGVVVKPSIAAAQLQAERQRDESAPGSGPLPSYPQGREHPTHTLFAEEHSSAAASAPPRRFIGEVELRPDMPGKDASQVAAEVIAHLNGLRDARVRVRLMIEAEVPEGIPEHVQRVVTENARTLNFQTSSFENE
jgi:hypothetical protein